MMKTEPGRCGALLHLLPLLAALAFGTPPAQALMGELDEDDSAAARGELRLPAGVRVLRDQPYGADAHQRYDVYLPPAGAARHGGVPVLFMVHGGAWRVGDKASRNAVEQKVAHWVGQGWALVSVNYRLLPEARANLQAEDIAHALGEVQAHAADWGGDRRQFVLMGHSAGAHLLALLAGDPPSPYATRISPWRAVVLLDSAAYDVPQLMQLPHFRFYDDVFGKDPKYWLATSPYHVLTHPVAPILAVCSGKRATSCSQAERYVAKVREVGSTASVLRVDLTHGELNRQLGSPGDYTRQVDQFLRPLLGAP